MTKVDRSSPTARPKSNNAHSTLPVESSITSSKTMDATADSRGHVDNASALPTCPQPQQQTPKLSPHEFEASNGSTLPPFGHIQFRTVRKPPIDSSEEAKHLAEAAYFIRDRDHFFGTTVARRVQARGVREKPIAPSSSWQNGFVERLISLSGRVGRWIKIRPDIARFNESGSSSQSQSWVVFTIITSGRSFRCRQTAIYI